MLKKYETMAEIKEKFTHGMHMDHKKVGGTFTHKLIAPANPPIG